MWNKDDVKPAPTSWSVIFDPKEAAKYKGKISAYDEPIYIADAADLPEVPPARPGDRKPLRAERGTVQRGDRPAQGTATVHRRILVGSGQADLRLRRRRLRVGTTWQYQYFALQEEGVPVEASPASQGFLPKEGATGWSDTWMISSEAKHPNCMYEWMNWIIEPKINAEVAEYFGEAPAQSLACKETAEADFCSKYHAEDPEFWKRVYYWETPLADCGERRQKIARTTTTGSRPGPKSKARSGGSDAMAI